jgi:hypothetical protein
VVQRLTNHDELERGFHALDRVRKIRFCVLQIRDDISAVADTVNQIEWLRKQLEVIETMLRPPKKKEKEKPSEDDYDFGEPERSEEEIVDEATAKKKADLLKIVEAMDQKLQSIEYKLVSPALANSDDKYFVEGYRVYLNLIWLNAEVGTGGGDVAGGADFPPTDTQYDSLVAVEAEMTSAIEEYQKLLNEDLPTFNRSLTAQNVAAVVIADSCAAWSKGLRLGSTHGSSYTEK